MFKKVDFRPTSTTRCSLDWNLWSMLCCKRTWKPEVGHFPIANFICFVVYVVVLQLPTAGTLFMSVLSTLGLLETGKYFVVMMGPIDSDATKYFAFNANRGFLLFCHFSIFSRLIQWMSSFLKSTMEYLILKSASTIVPTCISLIYHIIRKASVIIRKGISLLAFRL